MKRYCFLLTICILLSFCLVSCNLITDTGVLTHKLTDKESWLCEVSAENVTRIDVINQNYGVAPGTLAICYFTDQEKVIKKAIEYYSGIDVTRVSENEISNIDSGSGQKVVFTLSDGSTQTISFKYGYYVDDDGNAYRKETSIEFKHSQEMNEYYKFQTSQLDYDVYTDTYNPTKIGSVDNLTSWHFVEKSTLEEKPCEASMYIDAKFDKLYIISNTEFYITNERKDVTFYTCYELIDGYSFENLFELLED